MNMTLLTIKMIIICDESVCNNESERGENNDDFDMAKICIVMPQGAWMGLPCLLPIQVVVTNIFDF